MNNIVNIALRQFRSYFNSPVAYIVICVVLFFLGVFFWPAFFLPSKVSVREMYRFLGYLMVFAAPAMTMNLIAEEKRSGTIELLVTMPVKDWEVILGKYLAALMLYAVLLLLTVAYPLSVSTLGDLDWGPVVTGYVGAFLQGAAMLAIGLMASSFTENQLVAFFVSLLICAFLGFVNFWSALMPSSVVAIVEYTSMEHHLRGPSRGVIDFRDLVYFISIAVLGLLIAFRSIEKRRWV